MSFDDGKRQTNKQRHVQAEFNVSSCMEKISKHKAELEDIKGLVKRAKDTLEGINNDIVRASDNLKNTLSKIKLLEKQEESLKRQISSLRDTEATAIINSRTAQEKLSKIEHEINVALSRKDLIYNEIKQSCQQTESRKLYFTEQADKAKAVFYEQENAQAAMIKDLTEQTRELNKSLKDKKIEIEKIKTEYENISMSAEKAKAYIHESINLKVINENDMITNTNRAKQLAVWAKSLEIEAQAINTRKADLVRRENLLKESRRV